jgi:hypothetical protein
MVPKRLLYLVLATIPTLASIPMGDQRVAAQPPAPGEAYVDQFGEFRFGDDLVANSPSARRAAAAAAAQVRRDRARYQAHQRALRADANAWLGISPLRPTWPSTPMTHSYYQPRRIIYVPVPLD